MATIRRTRHVLEQRSTVTTRYELAHIIVVCPDNGWTGRDAGTRWELRYATEEATVEFRAEGGIAVTGDTDLHVFGVKLTKVGNPLTNVSHLLWWVRQWDDIDALREVVDVVPIKARLGKAQPAGGAA